MRAFVVLLALGGAIAGLPAPAHAEERSGGSMLGIGFGPGGEVSGALADHFGRSFSGRLRMGGRFDRLGVELVVTFNGLASERAAAAVAQMITPTVAYYLVARPPLQVAARVGLGYGGILGIEERRQVPCDEGEACVVRDETTPVQIPGFVLDAGATVQLHLGRGRGQRPVLWADVGVQYARFLIDDTLVTGRITQLTFGIAHAAEL